MTSQSPRIYLYKITFEEVPYYYYGVHKEKYFNEEYWGTPYTNKWCWELYTPKKQILELFDYTDEGWLEAQEVETRLIRPFYQTDIWCLNESCGGNISLKIRRENGKNLVKFKVGIHALTPEQTKENAKKAAQRAYELGVGIHALTPEQRQENSKQGGKLGGRKIYENKLGIHGRSPEQMSEDGRKGGSISAKIVNSQRWECCETGYTSTAAGIVVYQRARGIDTSKNNRRRIA
jgi:general stress protein YciG